MINGWIKIHRQIEHNRMWTAEPFTRGQAWIDLLLLANFTEGYLYVRGIKKRVERGQVGWSVVRLAGRWQWSRTKVCKFLNDLEEEQQIVQQKNNETSILTILNYDRYQDEEQQNIPQKSSRRAAEEQQKDTIKNDKKEKKDKKETQTHADFEIFWTTYDKKVGRPKAEKKWSELNEELRARIIEHVRRYVQAKPDKQYRKDPATYLNQKGWEDEIITRDEKPRRANTGSAEMESVGGIFENRQRALKREEAIRKCGKCKNGFIRDEQTNTAKYCECVKQLT